MYFHAQTFLYLFLPLLLAGYYVVPAVLRIRGPVRQITCNLLLFLASLFFYAWGEKEYVGILLSSLIINYLLALVIEWQHKRGKSGRVALWLAITFDLGLLLTLKYLPFLVENLSLAWVSVGGSPLPVPRTHLPIGVSFFTFQAISYIVDVARREVPAESSFLRFGLYVFLFPHLIAGPIVRYRDIAGQLQCREIQLDRIASGVHRFVQGLAKKVLLADTLARCVDPIFLMPGADLASSAAWLGLVAYAPQIYFDFSGYSDMAIGLGRMFGFEFLENFDHPYASASVTEFWRRWHISLSSWFRDYVYIPLGGNRHGTGRTYFNLMLVFLLCGLWHGANWTFLIWGAWHGLFLILERAGLGAGLRRLPWPLQHAYTLLVVLLGWVCFRAESLTQIGNLFTALFGFTHGSYIAADFVTNQLLVAMVVGVVISVPVMPWLAERWKTWEAKQPQWSEAGPALANLACMMLLLATSMVWLAGNSFAGFIYFRF